jgi:hypothetical protein
LVFSVDRRPVDGLLTEIILEKLADGKYEASKHQNFIDRTTGAEKDNTEVLAVDLECVFSGELIKCGIDNRPVDGQLWELIITRRADSKYDATKHTVFFSRTEGRSIESSETIETGLSLLPDSGQAEVEIDGSDANTLFGSLENFGVVDTDRLIGATNLRVKDLRCDTDVSNSARKIRCSYSAVNANTGRLETFRGVEGAASDDIFAVLAKHGLSVNAGINPNYRAVAAKALICSLPVVPNPIAHCVAERL